VASQLAVTDLAPESTDGLEARTHDPLWLLARQWQLGELRGEDAGSPAGAHLAVQWAPVALQLPGPAPRAPPVPTGRPLEAQVEAEPWATAGRGHFRLAGEAGQRAALLLRAAGAGAVASLLRDHFRLEAPPAGATADAAARRYASLLAGRAIDGLELLRAVAPGGLPASLGALPSGQPFDAIAAGARDAARGALDRWLRELTELAPEGLVADGEGGGRAWQRERMEYAFAASARLGDLAVALDAPEHLDGRADWTTFTIDPSRAPGPSGPSRERAATFLPTPVRLPGAPLPRFWELEDARVNLPRLEAARTDPASRMFLDFALRFSNDWFSVPLRLPAGTLSRIRSLVVTDTFGERQLLRHASLADGPGSPWRMYALSIAPSNPDAISDPSELAPYLDLFLLPAAPAQVLESPAVEEVRLLRDEMANLAWAVEALVESPAGRPVDVAEQDRIERGAEPAPPPPPAGMRRYRLGVGAPDHWVPLLPVEGAPREARRLERGAAPRVVNGEIAGALLPRGRVLEPGTVLQLYDEEVPREGAVVRRSYRLSRAADGTTHLWIGRRKGPGRGEGSSGLRFDVLE